MRNLPLRKEPAHLPKFVAIQKSVYLEVTGQAMHIQKSINRKSVYLEVMGMQCIYRTLLIEPAAGKPWSQKITRNIMPQATRNVDWMTLILKIAASRNYKSVAM